MARAFFTLLYLSFTLLACISCTGNPKENVYDISCSASQQTGIQLKVWDVYGPMKQWNDTLTTELFKGTYSPKYEIFDLAEVFQADTLATVPQTEDCPCCYLRSTLRSDTDITLYMLVSTDLPNVLMLNSDTLKRRGVSGLDIYPLHLHKGNNTLTAKLGMEGNLRLFEATVYDSVSIGRVFAEGQSGNIAYAMVDPGTDTIVLTNMHQNLLDCNASISIEDVNGNEKYRIQLAKDSTAYHVDGLQEGHTYMCLLHLAGTTVRQPILYGQADDALPRFRSLRDSLADSHHRAGEADGLLYRLEFLLNHPSRTEGDWWWQFKVPAVTYQLEHTFARLDTQRGITRGEPNMHFITYRSELDSSEQHYTLMLPDNATPSKPLPLVIVVRPHIDKHYHLFASPQIAANGR